MSKKELKQKLHRLVDEMEDEQALNMLYEDSLEYKNASDVQHDELTAEQWALIRKAKSEIETGNYFSHEVVMQHLRQWKDSK